MESHWRQPFPRAAMALLAYKRFHKQKYLASMEGAIFSGKLAAQALTKDVLEAAPSKPVRELAPSV